MRLEKPIEQREGFALVLARADGGTDAVAINKIMRHTLQFTGQWFGRTDGQLAVKLPGICRNNHRTKLFGQPDAGSRLANGGWPGDHNQ